MISLSAMQSAAIVLLALLLIASTGAAAKRLLDGRSANLAAESDAFKLARQVDALYRDACVPGALCVAVIRLPPAASISFTGNGVFVQKAGCNATSPILAPILQSNWHQGNGELTLRWES